MLEACAARASPHPAIPGQSRVSRGSGDLLDAIGVARAHFIGESVGDMVLPYLATWDPERVASFTAVSSIYTSVSDIGDAENISKSYVSRILRLALLAPDIVDAILAGRADQSLMLETLERPPPANWDEQRTRILEPWMS